MATLFGLKAERWTAAGAGAKSVSGAGAAGAALRIALAVAGVSLAARLAVPLPGTPVPASLQDLAVLAAGLFLGPAQGALAIAAYVGLGALGAPVFSNGHGGIAWLLGPTGGYLLAYPVAAWVMGVAGRQSPRAAALGWLLLLGGILAAQAVVFAGGVLQLSILTGQGLRATAALAVTPFVPGIVLKTALLLGLGGLTARRRRPAGQPGGRGGAPDGAGD